MTLEGDATSQQRALGFPPQLPAHKAAADGWPVDGRAGESPSKAVGHALCAFYAASSPRSLLRERVMYARAACSSQ